MLYNGKDIMGNGSHVTSPLRAQELETAALGGHPYIARGLPYKVNTTETITLNGLV
jgi:hypothetical protein